MNFTSDVKREVISRGIGSGAAKKAALSAFFRTSGILGVRGGEPAFFIVSETEKVAEFFTELFEDVFGETLTATHASVNRLSGRGKLVLEYLGERTAEILKTLGLIDKNGGIRAGISRRIVASEEAEIAYIKGAFLGGGSCTLPAEGTGTGYHLEIVFPDKKTASDFCALIADQELIARVVERGGTAVTYIKSKELISDFLSVIEAESMLKKFASFLELRDEANRSNRAANCFSGNADKTATAAVKQVLAIEALKKSEAFQSLLPELKELASFRLEYPALSLQELANKQGVSKSCLNHRMRRLMQLAETAVKENEKNKENE